jgi:23S rRNA (uridine2552-2'-O)-methyltransferase
MVWSKERYRLRVAAKSTHAKSCAKIWRSRAYGIPLMARYEPRDTFYRKARGQGLPSRAAFKLEELIARFRLARSGARVADLGCAPGGWLAILARAVGTHGRVVGIDLAQCPAPADNVMTVVGDIYDPALRDEVAALLAGPADLVTSDLSPKLTGIAESDQARSAELLARALEFAHGVLKSEGTMVAKLFMGIEFSQNKAIFARAFAKVEIAHTRASRPGSAELFLIARGFRAGLR